jgi:hypothetical protein
VPLTLPCSVPHSGTQTGGGEDAAAERAERTEGLHIGSPETVSYLDALGYPTDPAKPDSIFSHPDSMTQRLTQQIRDAEGR